MSTIAIDDRQPGWAEWDDRAEALRELVHPDPDVRRAALQAARARRWIDAYGPVTVRCVLLERASRALEHALTATGKAHTAVVSPGAGVLLLFTSERRIEDVDAWIQSICTTAHAVGSAELHSDEDDPRRAIDDARTAAELIAQVGGAIASPRAEDLGAWRLLHAVTGTRQLIASVSPAADELWRAADPMRRQTVEVYLDSGCNVAVACKQLFIHRTTLYYRLESMSELVRDALADGLKRSTLHMTLKLLHLWDDGAEPAPIAQLHERRASVR